MKKSLRVCMRVCVCVCGCGGGGGGSGVCVWGGGVTGYRLFISQTLLSKATYK